MIYTILHYSAAVLIALSWVLIALKNKWGFVASFIGCSCWVVYALMTDQWGLMGLNTFLAFTAIYGLVRWSGKK